MVSMLFALSLAQNCRHSPSVSKGTALLAIQFLSVRGVPFASENGPTRVTYCQAATLTKIRMRTYAIGSDDKFVENVQM